MFTPTFYMVVGCCVLFVGGTALLAYFRSKNDRVQEAVKASSFLYFGGAAMALLVIVLATKHRGTLQYEDWSQGIFLGLFVPISIAIVGRIIWKWRHFTKTCAV